MVVVHVYVQIEHYLKNNLKYKHSGATGTLASGRTMVPFFGTMVHGVLVHVYVLLEYHGTRTTNGRVSH